MTVSRLQIQELIDKWQGELGLSNWKIAIEIISQKQIEKIYDKNCGNAAITVNRLEETVILHISRPNKDLEFSVLHELFHLVLYDYDAFAGHYIPEKEKRAYDIMLDNTINKLVNITLKLKS